MILKAFDFIFRFFRRPEEAGQLQKAIEKLDRNGFCFVESSTAQELERESRRLGLGLVFEFREDCPFVRVEYPPKGN